MNTKHISIDLGDTLFDRRIKIPYGQNFVYPLFPTAEGVLRGWQQQTKESAGYKISIISKIDRGTEMRVGLSLSKSGIVPFVISAEDVHFCFERSAKGEIAKRIGSHIHIDDRVEALNSTHAAGVRYNILFIGAHDDRENFKLDFEDVLVAQTWDDVSKIVRNLP